ncbi:phosphoenolpyruvate synthase [Thiomicrorhabdus heinhorstiae]|uniref:Phosphoenolpyruvate synthase n=1 Tax=Thiomicrorhabdus heinhorstiae TaxID=2748010 RepID=A0ABS0BX81_9GAMM|nr:phosphoenolpyruvate synthase [Thiomicrorhabdus heinhorstiae]MBF6058398.1 phosphoenolpyruvate synthase [Thiomicrorhabdus heinhorstiae]
MSHETFRYIKNFSALTLQDIPLVGGKNASLGEMFSNLTPLGVPVPRGFAITADAYRYLLEENALWPRLHELLDALDPDDAADLQRRGAQIRELIYRADLPLVLQEEMRLAYDELMNEIGSGSSLAIRSSATAEDLPNASFAGQQDTYLNISGYAEFTDACRRCFASLFTDRAIHYRIDQGFDHFEVALSIGVQEMVRSDLSASGVMFTIDTESGFDQVVLITGAYGLGENVVQGAVDPDEFMVHKPTFKLGHRCVLKRHLGSKKIKMVYSSDQNRREAVKNIPTSPIDRKKFCLNDQEVMKLTEYALIIEDYYSEQAGSNRPMDIEWAKDGVSGELFIVQARPETVVSQKQAHQLEQFRLCRTPDQALVYGRAVGTKIAAGRARVIESVEELSTFKAGEVLVSDMTTPDWEPVMKMASALVTNRGGRTCHAAIIARELGIPAVVGTVDATAKIDNGSWITVSCAQGDQGNVYAGQVEYEVIHTDLSDLPKPKTHLMMNIADPQSAFNINRLPNDGVGLARMEFIINNQIKAHPMALLYPQKVMSEQTRAELEGLIAGYESGARFFTQTLSEGIGQLAAAFYPKPVVIRLSDFKSNEYANLLGGKYFELHEENPMIGFRGAVRYNDPDFAEAFELECQALQRVRQQMGLKNVIIMVPFCRRVQEAKQVLENLAANGLVRGQDGLQVYMMCEIPNNVLLIDEFSEYFDGFSIGTNDLTQLVLGVDRDSQKVAADYDERDPGVKKMVAMAIEGAKRNHRHIGLCGQAPSDFPDYTEFLVEQGIDAISLNPDSILKTQKLVLSAEASK